MEDQRINNFDLIRLFAASQVMLLHVANHIKLQPEFSCFKAFLATFPGVPIFFTISGFLITASIFKNPNISFYFRNRYLRIYPALYLCFILTFIILHLTGVLSSPSVHNKDILLWSFLSIFTIYPNITPPSIKNLLITNDPNGSLWTIPIEIQFYLLIPILYLLFKKNSSKVNNYVLLVLIIVSLLLNFFRKSWENVFDYPVFWRFFACSIFPYFWNFGFGMILYLNWEKIRDFFKDKFIIWGIVYLASYLVFKYLATNNMVIDYILANITKFVLSCMVISLAYSHTYLSKILKRNDISYGVYIYHMPVANFFILYWGIDRIGNPLFYISILATVLIISFLSWKMIEYPSLKLKRYKIAN